MAPQRLAAGRVGEVARRVIQLVGIAFVGGAVPGAAAASHRGLPGHRVWVAFALALAMFLPLAAYQVRWSSYAQVLLVPPYSAFVAWLLLRVGGHLPPSRLQLVRPLILVAALFWPLGLAQLLPQQETVTATERAGSTAPAPRSTGWGGPGRSWRSPTMARSCSTAPGMGSCRSPTIGRSRASTPAIGR